MRSALRSLVRRSCTDTSGARREAGARGARPPAGEELSGRLDTGRQGDRPRRRRRLGLRARA